MIENAKGCETLKEPKSHVYRQLFLSTLKLSACTFGALLTVLGTVLPPLVIISVISLFYQAFRDNAIVNLAMAGMLCGVAAVIFDVVINMAKKVLQAKKVLPVLVLLGSFLAVRFFHVNIIVVILVCGVIGALETWHRETAGKEAEEK